MEEAIRALENLLEHNVQRHKDLLSCLKLEQAALVDADIDTIIETASRKEDIAVALMEARPLALKLWTQVFPGKRSRMSVSHIDLVAPGNPGIFAGIRQSLISLNFLQEEVRSLTGINKAIAEDSLSFLRDLYSRIVVGEPEKPQAYTRQGQGESCTAFNRLVSQEV